MMHEERIDGPTPNGGSYSIARFFDAHGNAVSKAQGSRMEIAEYDTHDQLLFVTRGNYSTGGEHRSC